MRGADRRFLTVPGSKNREGLGKGHYFSPNVFSAITGRGHTSRDMNLAGLRTCLTVVEVNLCDLDAAAVLADIAAGVTPACLLPFVPLMQGGAEPAIIVQWVQLASTEPDARRQGDYAGLARVFAEAADCRPVWEQALQGFNVIQS